MLCRVALFLNVDLAKMKFIYPFKGSVFSL
jgi:hypothetical protein